MRIRRRATVALPHAQAPFSPSSQPRSPPAPPPSAPSPAPALRSGTAAARWVEQPACEVDRTMCEAAPMDPRPPSRGGNRQEEEKEESGKAAGDEKRGEEHGGSEQEHGRPVHVVCSTRAAPKREGEERRTEVEEKDRTEDSRSVKDEEKTAAMCKKGDGKGWHCKRVAQCGYSLCQYHLDKLRSYSSYSQKKKKKKKPKPASASERSSTAGGSHRRVASQQKKQKNKSRMEEHVLTTGPGVSDSFYYYSGFGPLWGKRRGDRSLDGVKVPDGGASQVQLLQNTAAAREEEEEEGGENDCDSAGRDGRPMKSRALSSLLSETFHF